jgi:hypothetical protein
LIYRLLAVLDGARRKLSEMRPAGFEPATYGLEDRCSIH